MSKYSEAKLNLMKKIGTLIKDGKISRPFMLDFQKDLDQFDDIINKDEPKLIVRLPDKRKKPQCPECSTPIMSPEDKYCRGCGQALKMK